MQRCAPIWQRISVNILDISQTIVQGYFNMMMIVDAKNATEAFRDRCQMSWQQLGEEIGVSIKCQHEDIFNKMHRI